MRDLRAVVIALYLVCGSCALAAQDPWGFLRALEPFSQTPAIIQRRQELGIQQGWLDLARDRERRLAELERESRRLQDRVLDQNFGYTDFRTGVANWRLNQDVIDAFAVGRRNHDDFDALVPIMRIIADGLRPQWGNVTMTEYVECLYSVAKNASFAAQARASIEGHANRP
jgi:hypothetical protein